MANLNEGNNPSGIYNYGCWQFSFMTVGKIWFGTKREREREIFFCKFDLGNVMVAVGVKKSVIFSFCSSLNKLYKNKIYMRWETPLKLRHYRGGSSFWWSKNSWKFFEHYKGPQTKRETKISKYQAKLRDRLKRVDHNPHGFLWEGFHPRTEFIKESFWLMTEKHIYPAL